jgi:hypothetical protein
MLGQIAQNEETGLGEQDLLSKRRAVSFLGGLQKEQQN